MEELTKLKDIKPPIEIDTFWQILAIYTGSIFSVVLLALGALFLYLLFKNRRKRRKRLNAKELALKALQEIDFKKTKDAVYSFSINAQKLVKSEQESKLKEILNSLEKYKYKKETQSLKREDIKTMKEFIKELKVDK